MGKQNLFLIIRFAKKESEEKSGNSRVSIVFLRSGRVIGVYPIEYINGDVHVFTMKIS